VSVIPATWEVEIGELYFEASLGKKLTIPHLKNKLGMVVYICNLTYEGGVYRRILV
jgi:hypothetical protein